MLFAVSFGVVFETGQFGDIGGKRFVDIAIVLMLFLAVYFAVAGGEYSVFEIGKLEALEQERAAELARTRAEIDSLRAIAIQLESDPEAIEREARERYGMIRDQLLGVEAVLADGTVISSLTGVIKNNELQFRQVAKILIQR